MSRLAARALDILYLALIPAPGDPQRMQYEHAVRLLKLTENDILERAAQDLERRILYFSAYVVRELKHRDLGP